MGCNCGKRAKGLLSWLGYMGPMKTFKADAPSTDDFHVRFHKSGVVIWKESAIKQSHFRVTVATLLLRMLGF